MSRLSQSSSCSKTSMAAPTIPLAISCSPSSLRSSARSGSVLAKANLAEGHRERHSRERIAGERSVAEGFRVYPRISINGLSLNQGVPGRCDSPHPSSYWWVLRLGRIYQLLHGQQRPLPGPRPAPLKTHSARHQERSRQRPPSRVRRAARQERLCPPT